MKVTFKSRYLKKRFPLLISRGLIEGSNNLFVEIEKNGYSGLGEMAPGKIKGAESPESAQASLEELIDSGIETMSIHELYNKGLAMDIPRTAYAALDIALWDLHAKEAGMPLYKLLAFPKPKVPTSVTIGINPPKVIQERIPLLMEENIIHSFKIKLGSPEGIESDKEMFSQVFESTRPYDVNLRVDANGGWDVEEAIEMIKWLSERSVDYVEQPLVKGREEDLPYLYKNRKLPIYVDESCRMASDIPQWADSVDGVNMKLMKCGGITEALRIISTAQAHGLKTMIGCMGESSVSIAAGAAISGVLDHIDLDSHLNLDPDPYTGAPLVDGVIVPSDRPGHGAFLKNTDNNV